MPIGEMWGGMLGGLGGGAVSGSWTQQQADPNYQGQWSSNGPGNPFVCQYCLSHGCSGQCQQNIYQQILSTQPESYHVRVMQERDNALLEPGAVLNDAYITVRITHRYQDGNVIAVFITPGGTEHQETMIRQGSSWLVVKNGWRMEMSEYAGHLMKQQADEWCPIHGGLREKGTPCMFCEPNEPKLTEADHTRMTFNRDDYDFGRFE